MARRKFSNEFKREAVHLVSVRGVMIAQAAQALDVHATALLRWVRQAKSGERRPFPVTGVIGWMMSDFGGFRARERSSKRRGTHRKGRGLVRQRPDLMFGFVARHRRIGPVSWICDALGVSRS